MTPLSGLRVVELPAIGPVPFAGMQLADMGADVIRIDRVESAGLGIETAARFDVLGRGKRSIALDLKADAARVIALQLAARADVVIEGFRPGVAERLGLGPADCQATNPALVYGRIPGFGRRGPLANRAGHDIGYLALSGLLGAIGPAAHPVPPLNLVGDFGGAGMALVNGILAALYARDRSSAAPGAVVDASILGGATGLSGMLHGLRAAGLWTDQREDNVLDGGAPYYRCYETRDKRFMAIGAIEPRFYKALVDSLDLAEALPLVEQNNRAQWNAAAQHLADAFAARSRDEWTEHFSAVDACCEPVLSLNESRTHPQALANGAFTVVDGTPQPAPFPQFNGGTTQPGSAPAPGEHTLAVLDELGTPADERQRLIAASSIATTGSNTTAGVT